RPHPPLHPPPLPPSPSPPPHPPRLPHPSPTRRSSDLRSRRQHSNVPIVFFSTSDTLSALNHIIFLSLARARCASSNSLVLFPLRSEEHTSELQSRSDLVCRLLLEKKKYTNDHVVDGWY